MSCLTPPGAPPVLVPDHSGCFNIRAIESHLGLRRLAMGLLLSLSRRPSLNRPGAAFGRMSHSLPGGAPPAFMVNAPKLQGEVRNVQSLAWSIPPCVSGAARAAARRVRRHDRDRN